MQTIRFSMLCLVLMACGYVFPMSIPDSATALGLSLMSNAEIYKKKQADLEHARAEFKKRLEDGLKSVARMMNKVTLDLNEAQGKIKGAPEQETDFLNKKVVILNDRRQHLSITQDQWQEMGAIIEEHLKVITEIITFLQTPKPELKPVYTWKDFRDVQLRVAEYEAKVEHDKARQENVAKQLIAAQERLKALEKQLAVKERLIGQDEIKDKSAPVDSATQRYEADILDQQLNALSENIMEVKLLIEKLGIEQKYWNDVVVLGQYRFDDQKSMLKQIENRLILDHNDVDVAKNVWKSELQSAFAYKEQLNKVRDEKKEVRDKLIVEIDFLREKIGKIKAAGITNRPDYLLLKSQYKHFRAHLLALDQELTVIDAKKDLADARASEKELQFNMVELRYRFKTGLENFDEVLIAFQNKKDDAVRILREFKDKRTMAIATLIDANRELDKLKVYKDKALAQKGTLFKGKERLLNDILANLGKARNFLMLQLRVTQMHLAVNADLISQQEKIVNQSQLMVNELEARQRTHSIWKRSPNAISVEALTRSELEVETFFKKLYWETPDNLNPGVVWKGLRSLTWYDLLLLLACGLLYVLSFIVLRTTITLVRRKIGSVIELFQGRVRYVVLRLIMAFADFVLEYFTLLFTWLFLFLHVYFDFDYIFQTLSPFDFPYCIAVFYVASIPILVYLSSRFISHLEAVNEQLSYRFISQAFAWRFMWLITLLCYATATLLPLRAAIISYADFQYAESASVLCGAYTLVLLVIVLLLFSKDDALSLLPPKTSFLIWLKRKVDKYYYPVFSFIVGLFILANPYVGYANMAWFLAFAVPSSILLAYSLFAIHFFIRKYAVFIFMKEDDEEIVDKFEHAKAYYGFFVIFSFIILFFVTLFLIMRIWSIYYSLADIWKALSEQWVIYVDGDNKVGLVEFMQLGLFVTCGFIISSVIEKFILNKLFEILRSEPGTQNTISRIAHYTVIFLAIVIGLNAIHLRQFIQWVGATFILGLGWAMKDIMTDWVAGFLVLIERPIEIGNYVQIDNVEGTVHKISARSTTLVTSRNHSITIPNKDLVNKWIVNWGHGRFAVGFEIKIHVEQTCDPDQVKRLLISVVQANPLILKVPAIMVRLEDIEESSFYFLVRAFISARRVKEQWEIAAFLRSEIVKAFRENNIALAKPTRKVYLGHEGQGGGEQRSVEIRFGK